jgi:uncharacterized protein (UPF0548 family)
VAGHDPTVTGLTYPEVGATRREPLPKGYDHLHYRTLIGTGADVFARAGEAIVTFRMHRAIGATVRATAERAAPGVRLDLGLGPFTVPCEVVYVLEEPNRAGFGYGTLPGHVQRGEEAFLVEHDQQDRVWFRVTAFSRPARWITVLGGPITIVAQRGYAALLGRALTRLSRTV